MADSSRGRSHGSAAGRSSSGSSYGAGRPPPARSGGSSPRTGRPVATGSARPPAPGAPRRPGPAGQYGQPRKPTKHRAPLWSLLLIVFGAVVLVAGLGGFGVEWYANSKVNSALAQTNLLGGDIAKGNSIKGAINILLVGLDTRPDNLSMGSRSDSIIIAHVPADHSSVFMVSIPRDTNAYIPPDKATGWGGGDLKINAAFEEGSMNKGGLSGGFQLLAQTVKTDYGISFNGGAIVDFSGFSDIVKKLGGVRMYVDEQTTSIHHGYLISNPSVHAKPYQLDPNCGCPLHGFSHPIPGTQPVVYTVGYHNLSAYKALDYVRIRDGLPYTDYDRQRHQQQFLKALIQEMYSKGLTNPTKLPGFLNSLGKAIAFDRGGVSLTDWIFTLKGLSPSSVVTLKTNDGHYDHYTGKAPDSRQQLDATSKLMLKDVVDDRMAQFIAQYPDWVSTS